MVVDPTICTISWFYNWVLLECVFSGGGDTAKRMPLVNVLAAGVHERDGVLEMAECTGHIEGGGKKDASFYDLFLKHMAKIGPTKTLF
jgi:hypothetical protein